MAFRSVQLPPRLLHRMDEPQWCPFQDPDQRSSERLGKRKAQHEERRRALVLPEVPTPIGVSQDDERPPAPSLQAPPPPVSFWEKYRDRLHQTPSEDAVPSVGRPSLNVDRPSLSMDMDESMTSFATTSTLLSPTGRAG